MPPEHPELPAQANPPAGRRAAVVRDDPFFGPDEPAATLLAALERGDKPFTTASAGPLLLPVREGGPMCRCVATHVPKVHVLEWHHIWPREFDGPTILENLIALCGSAHNEVHFLLRYMLAGRKLPDLRTFNTYLLRVAEQGLRRVRARDLVS